MNKISTIIANREIVETEIESASSITFSSTLTKIESENSETFYSAYVSQQNLLPDSESGPIHHPDIDNLFSDVSNGRYILKSSSLN